MVDTAPYHDRDGFIWFDGKLVPWREANVHVLTHALHYASAVFEGERAYGGEIFELTKHSQRLYDGAKVMDFTIPYSVAEIDQACRETVKANKLTDCYVRPIAWRGSEQMGVSAQATKIHLAVAAWDWGSYFPMEERLKGLRLTHRQVSPPRSGHGAGQDQGRRPLHDLHHRKAPRRARGLCRCSDVRLARPRGRVHRRQHLLHQGRRAAHADGRLLPRRHHARHRSSASPRSAGCRWSSAPSCPTSWARSRSAS